MTKMTPLITWIQKRQNIWPLLVLALLTGFLLYPVSVHPGSFVLGRPFDDVFESIWYLGWYEQALFVRHVSPLFQPDIFYPSGWELGFAVMPPLYPALFAPVTAVFGAVTTYNFLLIGSTLLAAYGVFRLNLALGGSRWGGIFAGLVFAFYPNRQVYMHGFLNFLLGSAWLPWMLYAFYQAVRQPARRGRWLALTGLFYSLSIGGAWQFVYISSLVLAIWGGVLLLPLVWREWRAWIRPFLAMVAVILLIAAPLLVNGLVTRTRIGASADFPLDDLTNTSISLDRLLVPSAWNPLFWDLARATFPMHDGEDSIITFGFSTLLLAAVALLQRHPNKQPGTATKRLLLIVVLFGLLLMTGPFLKWEGQPLVLSGAKMTALGQRFPVLSAADGIKIPMPALLIYEFVPPLRSFHHFGRIGMVVAIGLGILAGMGLTALTQRVKQPIRPLLLLAAFAILLLELNTQPQPQVTAIDGMVREVDAWLAAQPEQHVIMEYPLWHTPKAQSLYYYLAHQQKMVQGYSIIWPATFLKMRPTLETWPEETAVNLLADIGVDYVLVHVPEGQEQTFIAETLPQLQANDTLTLAGVFHRVAAWDSEPTYFFGQIQPMVDPMAVTYVFAIEQ
ncbi:MAG: hypothetical protein H6660_14425 [Ardenticatenaceae bacterium]|nr:hypothetical protein [Ardenticatenaceae bacterium]